MSSEDPLANDSVLVTSAMAAQGSRTVKHANTFAVFDGYGDIRPSAGGGDQGVYHNGTRFLSRYEFLIEGVRPLLLSSDITRDNHLIAVDLTNPDLMAGDRKRIQRGLIHVFRSKFLWQGHCYERYRISNYGLAPLSFKVNIRFACDFADIFEVRGMVRSRKGNVGPPVTKSTLIEIPYEGVDGIRRRTRLEFSLPPETLNEQLATVPAILGTGEEMNFSVVVSCLLEGNNVSLPVSSATAYRESSLLLQKARGRECEISTSNMHINTLLERAISDLRMLLTEENGILYPYAGIPWFCTPFGRDGLITALETLWFNADISRGVLDYLAANQAREVKADQDAEPGKILHEIRMGEMTNAGELPFAKYYGSADATPLFIVLAGRYLRRSGDIEFARKMWPHIESALNWIDTFGDQDGDGFVEYIRKTENGIENQAWKDSSDSVFHQDGALAQAPIAICEVQGYVFAAKKQAAFIADHLGFKNIARDLRNEAADLRKKFEHFFWDKELPGYVLALDRNKRPCRVKSSNMGHCLFANIASPAHARVVAKLLMEDSFFSGWGIRTLARGEPRFNPMSYHNGSIWPHDNAIVAEGLANYGFKAEAARILTALSHMSQYTELNRLPELFCGFRQRPNQGPTLYPVACSPQAWSAASIFSLLQSCLGLSIHALNRCIHFQRPYLPENIQNVTIRNLTVGDGAIDFTAVRHQDDVGIHVIKRTGAVSVVIDK
ncbi:MAG: amylo-alpha-1,6-glucosidase [Desulfobacteraceae bacterium]|nr:MAG: amylo-alpha-1,6-glucosidase [Desulfobacteraceae bacterium]